MNNRLLCAVLVAATLFVAACSDDAGSNDDSDTANADVQQDGVEGDVEPDDAAADTVDDADDADAAADTVDDADDADAAADTVDDADDAAADAADAAVDAGDADDVADAAEDADASADAAEDADASADVADADDAADAADADDAADAADADDAADSSSDVADTDATDADVAPDTASDTSPDAMPDATPGNPCEAAGGVCLGGVSSCLEQGGTEVPEAASGCVFDDGAGACCLPPAAEPTGDSCEDHGGLCAPISGCNFVGGSFAANDEACPGFAGIVCCLPKDVCGDEDVLCCGESASFRPVCDRGTFVCDHVAGTTLVPADECVF